MHLYFKGAFNKVFGEILFFFVCVCGGGGVAILTFYLDFSPYLNTYWIGNR